MTARTSAGFLVALALAGCTGDTDSASDVTSTSRTVPPPETTAPSASGVSSVIAADEWQAVIDDWYEDGTFDDPHRCEAVREALAALPSRDYSDAYATIHRLERQACG